MVSLRVCEVRRVTAVTPLTINSLTNQPSLRFIPHTARMLLLGYIAILIQTYLVLVGSGDYEIVSYMYIM